MHPADVQTAGRDAAGGSRFYRPELDGLRFLAFLAVFFCHTFPADPSRYSVRHLPLGSLLAAASRAGSFGVDLFFLLSAYLITELLLREQDLYGRIHLKFFYARRILRIWPLYLLAVLIAALLPLADSTQHFPPAYIAAFLLFSGNWLVSWRGMPASVMNILWSVSFEEQFYLLWPLVIARMRPRGKLPAVCLGMLVLASAARLILLPHARNSDMIWTNTLTRLDPIALGVMTAVLLRRKPVRLPKWARVSLLLSGLAVWLACGHFFGLSRGFMLLGYPCVALGALLIFFSAHAIKDVPAALLYLGKISYGLYVFHTLCLYLMAKLLGGPAQNAPQFAAYWFGGMALTIAAAALSYRFFESPFLRYKERLAYVRSKPV